SPGHAYGAAAVTSMLKGEDFPMSKRDILQKHGDHKIEWTKGNPVKFRDVLEDLPDETFNSPADLEKALKENM
ncbi:MAG: DUF2795 domain-containing protein, partial [Candidatus Gastranaerophilales bacterium]|nr:DUF2795 domain-containing protein [Candidatus Gastranaerophilales bacterium]